VTFLDKLHNFIFKMKRSFFIMAAIFAAASVQSLELKSAQEKQQGIK
jgi:hypothetical protein